jgi:hypothetical protein
MPQDPLGTLRLLHGSCKPECLAKGCGRGNCTLRLPPRATVSVDCDRCRAFRTRKKRPDFVVLHAGDAAQLTRWFVVEMKQGDVTDRRRVVEQLQEGATTVEQHASFRIPGAPGDIVPLLLYGGRIHAADVQVLRRQKLVRFRGRALPVQVRRCGTRLIDLA